MPGDECLIIWLPFDKGSGLTAYDRGKLGHNGTLAAAPATPTWYSKGKFRSCLKFDAADDYVSVPDHNDLDITGEISLMAWIFPLGWGEGTFGRILDKGNAYNLMLNQGSPNGLSQNYIGNTGVGNCITLNSWQHVIYTHDDAADEDHFYVDGVDIGGAIANVANIGATANPLIIGNEALQTRTFDGYIDELIILNRVIDSYEAETWATIKSRCLIDDNPIRVIRDPQLSVIPELHTRDVWDILEYRKKPWLYRGYRTLLLQCREPTTIPYDESIITYLKEKVVSRLDQTVYLNYFSQSYEYKGEVAVLDVAHVGAEKGGARRFDLKVQEYL